jgi:hypothetical protein
MAAAAAALKVPGVSSSCPLAQAPTSAHCTTTAHTHAHTHTHTRTHTHTHTRTHTPVLDGVACVQLHRQGVLHARSAAAPAHTAVGHTGGCLCWACASAGHPACRSVLRSHASAARAHGEGVEGDCCLLVLADALWRPHVLQRLAPVHVKQHAAQAQQPRAARVAAWRHTRAARHTATGHDGAVAAGACGTAAMASRQAGRQAGSRVCAATDPLRCRQPTPAAADEIT